MFTTICIGRAVVHQFRYLGVFQNIHENWCTWINHGIQSYRGKEVYLTWAVICMCVCLSVCIFVIGFEYVGQFLKKNNYISNHKKNLLWRNFMGFYLKIHRTFSWRRFQPWWEVYMTPGLTTYRRKGPRNLVLHHTGKQRSTMNTSLVC